jgi:hypothetical protein
MTEQLVKRLTKYCRSEWYDFSHVHPSLEGIENRNLKAIIEIERFIGIKLELRKLEHQRWIQIDLNNSDYDAVFVHTKNPNRDDYPVEFEIGRITKSNGSKYKRFIDAFTKNGYNAFKMLGRPTIVAKIK